MTLREEIEQYLEDNGICIKEADGICQLVKERIKKLIAYCMHKEDCLLSQRRMGEPTDEEEFDGYKTLFGYGNNTKWYGRNKYPECTCGLDTIITELSGEKE